MAFEVHRSARERDCVRHDGCVRRERVLAGAGQLLCRGRHEQQGGPAEPEPDAVRLHPEGGGLVPGVDGGEPGGLDVQQLRAAHGRVCAALRLLDVRALRERGRVHEHAVHDRPDTAGASAHGVTRACGRGGLQAVDVRGGRRGD